STRVSVNVNVPSRSTTRGVLSSSLPMAKGSVLEQAQLPRRGGIPGETFSVFTGSSPRRRRFHEGLPGSNQRGDITALHQAPSGCSGNHLGRTTDAGGDHWRTAGHGFEQHIGPSFAAAAQSQRISSAVPPLQIG